MVVERTVAENAWELDEGLYRILLPLPWALPFVNAYLVASRGEYMLVDCGANWEVSLRALGWALKAIGVPAHGLTTLLLTHRHEDHDGGSGPVQARWGGRALVHPAEIDDRPTPPALLAAWLQEHGAPPAEREAMLAAHRAERSAPPALLEPLPLDRPLQVGDLSFQVIPVPGHSPGQVMLHEPDRGWLLAADQVPPRPALNVWVNPLTTGDPLGEYLDSLSRTARVDARLVLSGHGSPLESGLPEAAEAMAAHHRRYAEQVRQALNDSPLTTWEVLCHLHPRGAGQARATRFGISEVLAALTWLERNGAAVRTGNGWLLR